MKTVKRWPAIFFLSLCLVASGAGASAAGVQVPAQHGRAPEAPTADWQIETIEDNPVINYLQLSLALDQTGRPHISYWSYNSYSLMYAKREPGGWAQELVALQGVGPSLALDANGLPRIAYHDGGYSRLGYAYHDGAAWHLTAADPFSRGDSAAL